MKNTLIFIMAIMLIASTYAYDYEESYEIKDTELPKNGTSEIYRFPFTNINDTLFFEQINSSDKVNLSFISNHTYTNNTDLLFRVNWKVSEHIIASNQTYEEVLKITNDVNNQSVTMGLFFNIEKTGEEILEINGSEEIVIVNGTYYKDITVDLLPDNGNITTRIYGKANTFFTLGGCTEFLECPVGQFRFNEEGWEQIIIPYTIPLTTAVGQYNTSFQIESENKNTTIDVIFDISIPNIFVRSPNIPEKCKGDIKTKPFDVQFECAGILSQHEAEKIIAYQNYIASVNTDKICENYVKTEFVVGDSISEEVIKRNLELLDENRDMREDLNYINGQMFECRENVIGLKTQINQTIISKDEEILQLKEEATIKNFNVREASEQDKEDFKNGIATGFKVFVFVLGTVAFIFMFFQHIFSRTRGIDPSIPQRGLLLLGSMFFAIFVVLILFV